MATSGGPSLGLAGSPATGPVPLRRRREAGWAWERPAVRCGGEGRAVRPSQARPAGRGRRASRGGGGGGGGRRCPGSVSWAGASATRAGPPAEGEAWRSAKAAASPAAPGRQAGRAAPPPSARRAAASREGQRLPSPPPPPPLLRGVWKAPRPRLLLRPEQHRPGPACCQPPAGPPGPSCHLQPPPGEAQREAEAEPPTLLLSLSAGRLAWRMQGPQAALRYCTSSSFLLAGTEY